MTTVSMIRGFRFFAVILFLGLPASPLMARGVFRGLNDDQPASDPLSEQGRGADKTAVPAGSRTAAAAVPREYDLAQNFPNPFNPSTIIRYAIPVKSHVLLTVHNLLGQVVSTIVNGEQDAGFHEIRFDAPNLASGVYLYRLEAGKFVETRKLTLIR
jgi:hypothetical protein